MYFYGARWYDPAIGRFLQADTIVPEPGDPQALNRYSYVLNNALRYTDPTGHNPACAAGMGGGPLGVMAALACEVWFAVASVGPQVQALAVELQQLAPLAAELPAAMDPNVDPPAAPSNAGNTADPGGLDPNDPLFKKLVEQAEKASCPNCKTTNPQLLRGRGAIAARQHVLDPAHIGKDGISAWCEGCGNNLPTKFWGHSVEEVQNFAEQIGLDPTKAAVYTPQYGGAGHYSLFIDAIGPDGYILPQYAELIDAFLRTMR